MKRLVIGILAHVDSGKTTLSEGLLYCSGDIKKLGRVDHGDALLDSYALERERGITIFSKQAVLRLPEAEFTLLDTPGHVDFSPEMERALQVLDYAVLVISGTDGVQSHTETLWALLARHKIPTFLFVNKMDLAGPGRPAIMQELKQRLSEACTDFASMQEGDQIWEQLALCDEVILEQFLETGRASDSAILTATGHRRVFPCYFGSALKLAGLEALLRGIERFTGSPDFHNDFGARVFKITRDEQGKKLTFLKITGGRLKVKTLLEGRTREGEPWAEKINQLRVYSGAKFQAVDEAFPGMICAATGLTQARPGEGLGRETKEEVLYLAPVLTYKVELRPENDARTALANLRILEEEEPALHVEWNEPLQEIHVQLMGEVQLEVIKSLILERFGLDVRFGQGSILYKETIAEETEGVGHFEPLKHYSEVHLILAPGERGSGLCFDSICTEDKLDKNWQNLILTHLEEKTHRGVLTGSPITDIRITLASGKAHKKHTEGGDFRQATYRAVRQGLRQAKSILLEPWYNFFLDVPPETVGRAMSDLQRMNGNFSQPEPLGDLSRLTGSVPVESMRDYQLDVASYTRGRGRLSCTLKGYEPCHNTEEVLFAIGYDSDGDLQNPSDSVFCAHGAGFNVKWDKVKDYMHLEAALNPKPPVRESEQKLATRRAAAYCATLEQDKELMDIYERTYGPIRRDSRSALHTVRSKTAEKVVGPTPPPLTGPEYLLVDGYNIIFAWDELSEIAKGSLDAARNRLINILCNYQGFCKCELILVFDAYKVKGNPGEVEKFLGISVVYTKEAETADMYIEKVTHKIAKTHRVRVATSDGLEQMIILSHGALRVSARAFQAEVEEAERDIRSFLQG